MILLVLSTIAIVINKFVFNYSIAAKGSLLLQIFYGVWIFSCMSVPIKAYNEYCDKKDEEKAELKAKQKAREKIQRYFEAFDYCDHEEKNVLSKFYKNQLTTCQINSVDSGAVRRMREKGIDIFCGCDSCSASVTVTGLKIINKYFDRNFKEN